MENIKLGVIITSKGDIIKKHIDMNRTGLRLPKRITNKRHEVIKIVGSVTMKDILNVIDIPTPTPIKHWHIVNINNLMHNVNDYQEGEILFKAFKQKAIDAKIKFYLYQ